jgi:hypothetical protein
MHYSYIIVYRGCRKAFFPGYPAVPVNDLTVESSERERGYVILTYLLAGFS